MCSTGFWAIFIHGLPVIWGFSRMKHLTSKRRDLDETPLVSGLMLLIPKDLKLA